MAVFCQWLKSLFIGSHHSREEQRGWRPHGNLALAVDHGCCDGASALYDTLTLDVKSLAVHDDPGRDAQEQTVAGRASL